MISLLIGYSDRGRLAEIIQSATGKIIAVAVLFCCASIVPRATPQQQLLLIGGILGIGIMLLFLCKPTLGLIAMMPACMIVPFELGTGTNTSLHTGILLLFLLVGLWLLRVGANRRLQLPISRSLPPLLLFLLACLLSFVVGQLPWFATQAAPLRAQIGGLAVFVLSVMAFVLVSHQIRELHALQWMTWVFLGLGAAYITGRWVPGLGGIARVIIRSDASGSLFWVWLVALALSQALFNQRLWPAWRATLLLLVAATLYVAFVHMNQWKSGWLPAMVSVAAILASRWWRLGVTGLAAGLLGVSGLATRLIASDEYSYATRLEAWVILVQIIKQNPIFGFGPANYYWYTPLFPIRGYYVQFNSHNQYMDLVAQTGIIGLLCFLWFAWEVGVLGWQLRTQTPAGFPRAYVYGVLGGLIGTLTAGMLGDWILPFVYNIGLDGLRASLPGWMFLGGLVALQQMMSQPWDPAQDWQPLHRA